MHRILINMRLDKLLCDAGYGSRSQVKNLIRKGQVLVNHEVVKKPEFSVRVEKDELLDQVICQGEELTFSKYEYYMLNKPAGVVSATKDNVHETVLSLIRSKNKELFPVGRLDIDTEGLLLITNDGALAHELLSPKKHVSKTYEVTVDKKLSEDMIEAFLDGVTIHDKSKDESLVKLLPAELVIIDDTHARVTIMEGKYHQVKRMFTAVSRKVIGLKRISMGTLFLDASLAPGEYRPLTEKELKDLKHES